MEFVFNRLMYSVGPGVIVWELLFRRARWALQGAVERDGFLKADANKEKLVRDGPSYIVAFVHACIVGGLGLTHLFALVNAPAEVQLAIPWNRDHPWHVPAAMTERTNSIFLSWLLYDLGHVTLSYPHLGGIDTIAHHVGFIFASAVCGAFRILPFPFAWLTVGELSSIALNVRWGLINTGRGDTSALRYAQTTFAVLFIATRIVLYGLGLYYLLEQQWKLLLARQKTPMESPIETPLLLAPVAHVPIWLLGTVCGLLVGGYGLNLVWLGKILHMATKPHEKKAGADKGGSSRNEKRAEARNEAKRKSREGGKAEKAA